MKQEKTYWQSDWAESGFRAPVQSSSPDLYGCRCVRKKRISGAEFRWLVRENTFESGLYGIPVLELRLVVSDPGLVFLNDHMDNLQLHEQVKLETSRLMQNPVWKSAYLYSRLIRNEPLHRALTELGFREVEQRSLYGCRFGELKTGLFSNFLGEKVHFCTLADLPSAQAASVQKQIVSLCREAFSQGFSRHFRDEFLFGIRPGVEYIILAMEKNFVNLEPGHFLIALSAAREELCAFTVVGNKPGLEGDVYTQLLSAVSPPWRGKKIYRGFADLLVRIFPSEAELLNVTHTQNSSIRKAYSGSGRKHIADAVILRRLIGV